MPDQPILPKPELDLPLPEKEIPAHAEEDQTKRKLPFPKYVFLGAVFVLLLIIVGGAYFLGRNSVFKELNPSNPVPPPADPVVYASPTPNSIALRATVDTSKWTTYKNTKIGFEIKSPLRAKVPSSTKAMGGPPAAEEDFMYFYGDEDKNDRNEVLFDDNSLLIYSSDFTLQDLFKRETSDKGTVVKDWSNFYTPYSNSKRTLLDLNGIKVVKVVTIENEKVNKVSNDYYHTGPPEYHVYYEFVGNNYWFILGYAGDTILASQTEKGKAAEQEMEQILSTFKFD